MLLTFSLSRPVITRDFIDHVNSVATWETTTYEENIFRGWTFDELKTLMGAKGFIEDNTPVAMSDDSPPTSFDARTKWPTCTKTVRNQGNCGSCWAFGTVQVLSDRFCINSVSVMLSVQHVIECEKDSMCCNGGYTDRAFKFLTTNGTVKDDALRYDANCAGCRNVSGTRYYCKNNSIWYGNPSNLDDIKNQIYNKGPITGQFNVYEDFMTYKSGVYKHTTGKLLGGHAIEVIGWGVESNTAYWLCKNSWGQTWGIEGFFKIAQGDCGINSYMISCDPKV